MEAQINPPSREGRTAGEGDVQDIYARYDSSPSVRRRWDARNPGNIAMHAEADRILEAMIRDREGPRLARLSVLDAGCGWGHAMAWLARMGVPAPNILGVDLMANRLESARQTYSDFKYVQSDLASLGLPDRSFDLIVCKTLFSSILDDTAAAAVASNLSRMLRTDGAIIWYDIRYANPWNPSVRAMTVGRIRSLFPHLRPKLRSMTLIPQLSRRLGPAISAYPLLASLPPLRTHLGGLLEASHA